MTVRLIGKTGLTLLAAAIAAVAIACTAATTPDDGQDANNGGQPTSTSAPVASNTPEGDQASLPPEETQLDVTGALFLQLDSPATSDMFVSESSLEIAGRTTVDALVSINDAVVEVDGDGRFVTAVDLEEGPNVVEVVASNAAGEQFDEVLLVIYEPA